MEVRSVGNANSKFIEENKNQFINVSTLNLRRAEQIRQQFNEQREKVKDELNDKNPKKFMHNSHFSARNTGSPPNFKGNESKRQSKLRPQTAYGGVAVPPRNIKSIVKENGVRFSADENGRLKNILDAKN